MVVVLLAVQTFVQCEAVVCIIITITSNNFEFIVVVTEVFAIAAATQLDHGQDCHLTREEDEGNVAYENDHKKQSEADTKG
jgi:hypothetical protein